jgi:hypothetical protein
MLMAKNVWQKDKKLNLSFCHTFFCHLFFRSPLPRTKAEMLYLLAEGSKPWLFGIASSVR